MNGQLELRGVTAGYSGTTALRDVDLIAPAGRVTAIIGPNGAGKTTLLRVASGLLAPAQGTVVVDGVDLTGLDSHRCARRGVCHVPEGRAVFPSLSVRENLALFAGTLDGEAIERAVLAFPRLGERIDQTAGTMSGGEQQMLALARAYVTDPTYVLLDEVSMGLAPKIVADIFSFLAELAQTGVALVIVEQYVHQVLALADVVYVLNKGRVALAAEPADVDPDELAAEYLGGTG